MSNKKKPKAASIEAKARGLAEPFISKEGFSLWDVIFEKEGAMWYLRILFDKPGVPSATGGVTADECEYISGPLNELMDKQDFISEVDILEIGSPGLTKKLRSPEHFYSCIGMPVRVTLKDENHKTIFKHGNLDSYNQQAGEIMIGEEIINLKNTIKVNLNL